jgi:BirA family biotin operon repressor/biotin-[acetyl-CoA-carboxylase] ligase
LATPYFQLRFERVPSTQDVARERFGELPLLVLAQTQTEGRGRSGAEWLTADRALAASLIFEVDDGDERPFSLVAGLAATQAVPGTSLKWPNDVLSGALKAGGILVERTGNRVVVGLGLNLWWPAPPQDAGALFSKDPGPDMSAEVGALWGAELMQLLEDEDWLLDDYREVCVTLGKEITWDPDGHGKAIDVAQDGSLVVETDDGRENLYSAAIRHLRDS